MKSADDPVLQELVMIKKLLIYALLSSGKSQKDVAGALGIDQSQISRMLAGSSGAKKSARKG